jgi:hypothetical protein
MPYIEASASLNGNQSTGIFACFVNLTEKPHGYHMPYFTHSTLDQIAVHLTKTGSQYAFQIDWVNMLIIRSEGVEDLFEDEIEIDGDYGWGYGMEGWPRIVDTALIEQSQQ